MSTEDNLRSSEYEKEMGYYGTEVGKEDLKQRKIQELNQLRDKQKKEARLQSIRLLKRKKKILKKIIRKKEKKLKKLGITSLQAEMARRKLLQDIISKKRRPVNIMANIEDKIPNVFTKEPVKQKMRWI